MRIEDITLEDVKKALPNYDYILAYEISKVTFQKVTDADINWDECTEAYVFNPNSEIHIFTDSDRLIGKIVTEDASESADYVDRGYPVLEKFFGKDKKLIVREYLGADDDGQAYVKYSRLLAVV